MPSVPNAIQLPSHGGTSHVPKTFTALELNRFLPGENHALPPGRYQFVRYVRKTEAAPFLEEAPELIQISIDLPCLIPRLTVAELRALAGLHRVKRPRGSLRADILNTLKDHNCDSCNEFISLVRPCAGNTRLIRQDEQHILNQDVLQKLGRSVKAFAIDENGAQWVTIESLDSPTEHPDDHVIVHPVPWMLLAQKATRPVLQYFCGFHGVPTSKRNKPELLKDLSAHACTDCPPARAIFKPVPKAKERTRRAPVGEVTTDADIDYVWNPPLDETVVFPPPPVTLERTMDILRGLCADMRPECLEEKGCAVCGSLTLLTDLKAIDALDCSLEPLVEPFLVKKARSQSSETVDFMEGPVLDNACDAVCGTCRKSLEKGKRPPAALANGLWLGEIPPVLAKLTYAEQCLIARVRTNRYVLRVSSGHSKLTANAIAFSMPTVKVYQHLPPRKEEMQEVLAFIFTGVNPPTDADLARTPMLVRRNAVADALEWLKLNHSDYSDLFIDREALLSYPESGVPVDVLYRRAPDGSNIVTAATSVHDNADEVGTTQGDCTFTVNGLIGDALDGMSVEAKKAAALRHLRMGGYVLAVGHSETPETMYDNHQHGA
ncbi:hypothetical protein MD484_g593, partial [Candolleomyces efflorescens]